MLEAPPDAALEGWSAVRGDEDIDALPYIDEDYGNPRVKAEVDRLVEEEMRRSVKKPADFLRDLPPMPKFDFEVHLGLNSCLDLYVKLEIFDFLFFIFLMLRRLCSGFRVIFLSGDCLKLWTLGFGRARVHGIFC